MPATSPDAVPAAPETSSRPLLWLGALSEIWGGIVSTTNVLAMLRPVCPARSDCFAIAVYLPSARCAMAETDQVPPFSVAGTLSAALPDAAVPG